MFRYVEVQYKVLSGVLFNSWTLFYSKIGKMVTTKQEEEEEEKGEEEEEGEVSEKLHCQVANCMFWCDPN